MKPSAYHTPALPTRERALYVAAARVYADAFRAVYIDPEGARRRFRMAADWDPERALAALLLHPNEYGPRRLRAFASAVHDPALIYWTQRERRPRAVLFRVAELLYAEAERRDHCSRIEAARQEAGTAGVQAHAIREERSRFRALARETVAYAEHVYEHPARACRVILSMVRRHGARRTRALLREWPEFFGTLRTVWYPRGVWPLLLVFVTTDEARGWVPRFLANAFDRAALAYAGRRRCGALRGAEDAVVAAHGRFRHLSQTLPESGALKEAARLLAVLFRRRDMDEMPQGKGPPPVERQLAAMLPARFAPLIAEPVQLSRKESGEDPIWNRERGLSLERGRSRERERGRSRGAGLSL
jgi:hypothetical protein